MKAFKLIVCGSSAGVLALLAVFAAEPAHAQQPGGYISPVSRPAVSPYINLLRSGASPAINYYGIVRPEIAFRSSINNLQGQEGTLATQQQELAAYTALPPTGHVSGFQTQGKYFMSNGGQVGSNTFSKGATGAAKSGKQ